MRSVQRKILHFAHEAGHDEIVVWHLVPRARATVLGDNVVERRGVPLLFHHSVATALVITRLVVCRRTHLVSKNQLVFLRPRPFRVLCRELHEWLDAATLGASSVRHRRDDRDGLALGHDGVKKVGLVDTIDYVRVTSVNDNILI